jgi:caa(3)-type oxidase subunit IV
MTDHAMERDFDKTPAGAAAHEHPPYGRVFLILSALTVIEVGLAFATRAFFGVAITLLIVIAIVKIAYIGRYFMHLKFDARILSLIAIVPASCATIMAFYLLMEYA